MCSPNGHCSIPETTLKQTHTAPQRHSPVNFEPVNSLDSVKASFVFLPQLQKETGVADKLPLHYPVNKYLPNIALVGT